MSYCTFMHLLYIYVFIYVYIFIVCLCIPSATLTEVFPCFFLSFKANARVTPVNGPHSSYIFVLFYVLFVLCRSVYCLCVNVY
jgi:hypothetical protein